MVQRWMLGVAVVAVVLMGSAGYYINQNAGTPANTVVINMKVTSGTPQNGAPDKFLPASFTVTEGEHVQIVFQNTDDGPHEFEIPALGVNTGIVEGGQSVRVNFVPNKVGTFAYDQPPGTCCYGGITYAQGCCTGAQETNGSVTVLAPS
ncbi:MAG: cupredoxin domain-containing protein [Nitrososphaerota archaeon]|nr:cupredoxin domain-containing protein [Nitrososphaerota archaeon]MDG7021636.1 cupredoxin domain-containing protein [Nitrososphaerota archaeon]